VREFTEKLKGDGFIDKNGGSSRESPVTFQGGYVMCLITEVLAVTLQRRLIQETQRNLIGEVLQGRLINYHHQEEIRDSNLQGKRNREFFFQDEDSYRVVLRWWEFAEDRAEDLGKFDLPARSRSEREW